MKIVVIGAGAMGTLFGGKLALAGAEVTMVDVVPEAVESMRRDGLVLELLDGVHRAPVEAYLAQDVPFIADLVVLFTKSLYSRAALESARRFMDSRTVVLSLQNGLGNLERISDHCSNIAMHLTQRLCPDELDEHSRRNQLHLADTPEYQELFEEYQEKYLEPIVGRSGLI